MADEPKEMTAAQKASLEAAIAITRNVLNPEFDGDKEKLDDQMRDHLKDSKQSPSAVFDPLIKEGAFPNYEELKEKYFAELAEDTKGKLDTFKDSLANAKDESSKSVLRAKVGMYEERVAQYTEISEREGKFADAIGMSGVIDGYEVPNGGVIEGPDGEKLDIPKGFLPPEAIGQIKKFMEDRKDQLPEGPKKPLTAEEQRAKLVEGLAEMRGITKGEGFKVAQAVLKQILDENDVADKVMLNENYVKLGLDLEGKNYADLAAAMDPLMKKEELLEAISTAVSDQNFAIALDATKKVLDPNNSENKRELTNGAIIGSLQSSDKGFPELVGALKKEGLLDAELPDKGAPKKEAEEMIDTAIGELSTKLNGAITAQEKAQKEHDSKVIKDKGASVSPEEQEQEAVAATSPINLPGENSSQFIS